MTDLFDRVQTYDDFIAAKVAEFTAFFMLPTPFEKKLLRLNKLGFAVERALPVEPNKIVYLPRAKVFSEVASRPYVQGYLPKPYLNRVLNALREQDDFFFGVWDLEWQKESQGWFKPPVHYVEMTLLETNMGNPLVLEKEREAATKGSLSQAQWLSTRLFFAPTRYDYSESMNITNVLVPDTVFVCVIGKSYGNRSSSTENLMLKILK